MQILLLSACRFEEFDSSFLICHVLITLYQPISIARHVLKSLSIGFQGKSLTYFVNMYCAHLFCRPASCFKQLGLQIQRVPSYYDVTDIIFSAVALLR